jgi:hypothetical protein
MRCPVASWHIASLAAAQCPKLWGHRKWSPQGQADAIEPNRKPRLLMVAVISPPQQRLAARKSTEADIVLQGAGQPIKIRSSIDLSQGNLLVHPHRQGMTSSDEKPNRDKDAAKAELSHSTGIRPPLVSSLANHREAAVGARCKPSLPSSTIVQGCREPSPVLSLAPGIRRRST